MSSKLSLFSMLLLATLLVFAQQNISYAQQQLQSESQIAILTVNINSASAEEIADILTGVGLNKAKSIVAYRDANGAYKKVDDLLNVKGIGPATLSKNRERLRL